jgi:hypothetical protein
VACRAMSLSRKNSYKNLFIISILFFSGICFVEASRLSAASKIEPGTTRDSTSNSSRLKSESSQLAHRAAPKPKTRTTASDLPSGERFDSGGFLISRRMSPWGYSLPVPFFQLTLAERQNASLLPLAGVGAVLGNKPPFRATATYLGKFRNNFLFGVSEHVAMKAELHSVEFGHLADRRVVVALSKSPLFSSVKGDFSIFKADLNSLTQEARRALEDLTPVVLAKRPVAKILTEQPETQFVVVGRASHSVQASESTGGSISALWSGEVNALWKAATLEASQHLDSRPDASARSGDILVLASANVVANGMSQELLDPDGLKSKPFLPSRPDWAPESIAMVYRSIGRMSGSPVFAVNKNGVVAVGIHWTKGDPEDLNRFWPQIEADPRVAFGKIISSTEGQPPQTQLKLIEPAPFAYASSVARAVSDLQSFVSQPKSNFTNPEQGADRQLLMSLLSSTK